MDGQIHRTCRAPGDRSRARPLDGRSRAVAGGNCWTVETRSDVLRGVVTGRGHNPVLSVAVTGGYGCEEPWAEFYRHMDAANVDLNGFTERFYRDVLGGHLQPVLDTLEYLEHETNVWFELTTLLIPGENDEDAEIDALSRCVAERLGLDVPLHFTAFHPDWQMVDRPPTPPATLSRARRIALGNGCTTSTPATSTMLRVTALGVRAAAAC
jgi:AmmeMemoRadiSam system radical SAM enzyme